MQVYEMKILEQAAVDEHHLIIVFYYLHNSQRRIHILLTLSTTRAALLPMRQSFSVQTRERHRSPWCIITDEICAFNTHRAYHTVRFPGKYYKGPLCALLECLRTRKSWRVCFQNISKLLHRGHGRTLSGFLKTLLICTICLWLVIFGLRVYLYLIRFHKSLVTYLAHQICLCKFQFMGLLLHCLCLEIQNQNICLIYIRKS